MTRPVLSAPRLTLRPLAMDHIPHLVELDADPEMLRYILGRARTEQEACDFWGPMCGDAYADHLGLGFWAGFATASYGAAGLPGARTVASAAPPVIAGEFLGWWCLAPARAELFGEDGSEALPRRAEAGWQVRRRFWRQGLAVEGARAVFDHGFTSCGLDTIWAETMAVNAASRGVMRRLGMRHVDTEVRTWDAPLPGADQGEVIYEVTRQEWTGR